MTSVRALQKNEVTWFAGLDPAVDEDFEDRLRQRLVSGSTRLAWCLVAEDAGRPVGRCLVALDDPTRTLESWLLGLWLRWGQDDLEVGPVLLREIAALAPAVGVPIDARINAADHPAPGRARAVLEAAGFGLLQEKEGFVWTDDGTPVHVPARLTFRSLRDVGEDAFIAAMAAGCAATLDRNDRYFYALVGPEGWGREMMGYAGPGDEDSWWLAHDVSGALVGYVMLSPFGEEGVGTIAHIGVVPGQRGRGYVHDLLQRTNAGAQERGFSSVLSDVDVRNAPMLAAMERAGHHAGVRPWHIWHYRWPPPVEG